MIKRITILPLLFLAGCLNNKNEKKFASTKYIDDLKHYKLEQKFNSVQNGDFIGIYYDDTRSLSGVKILKLYTADSISTAELYYGAHPLKISKWDDSLIIANAGVFSAHGDSAYRKVYLDGSVDKNKLMGNYKIQYEKNYNYIIK